MTCPICDREADTEYWGDLYCEECAEALSEEYSRVPLDRVANSSYEDALAFDEVVRHM